MLRDRLKDSVYLLGACRRCEEKRKGERPRQKLRSICDDDSIINNNIRSMQWHRRHELVLRKTPSALALQTHAAVLAKTTGSRAPCQSCWRSLDRTPALLRDRGAALLGFVGVDLTLLHTCLCG